MEQNNYQGALQQPIGSGFNATSTASDVIKGIDLSGKIAIVTGGNTGIGLEITKALTTAGATIIVTARDIEKAALQLSKEIFRRRSILLRKDGLHKSGWNWHIINLWRRKGNLLMFVTKWDLKTYHIFPLHSRSILVMLPQR